MTSDINGTITGIQGNAVEAGILDSSDDGYVLTWNNADNQYEDRPSVNLQSQTFISSGTWTCPPNVFNVRLSGFGGGGGGGAGYGTSSGGGGGACIQSILSVSVVPGMNYTITIGGGGSGASAGAAFMGEAGGNTTFGSLATFVGGSGGQGAGGGGVSFNYNGGNYSNAISTTAGIPGPGYGGFGSPGTGAKSQQSGYANVIGDYEPGSSGSSDLAYDGGGGGGAGPGGAGGAGGNASHTSSIGAGNDATGYGAGGGGGAGNPNAVGDGGGNGSGGQLTVSWIG